VSRAKCRGQNGGLQAPEAVNKSWAVTLRGAKDPSSCFWSSFLRRTAEMLRCAQHDRVRFFHTFSGIGTPSTRYTNRASPHLGEHLLTAKRWAVSSRGRKPTVGHPEKGAQPRRGCPKLFGPFRAGCAQCPPIRGFHPRLLKVLPFGEQSHKCRAFTPSFALQGF
jgi:hypothetical protein